MLQTATDNPGLRASRHGRGSRSDIYPTGLYKSPHARRQVGVDRRAGNEWTRDSRAPDGMTTAPPPCPQCGAPDVVPILYGYTEDPATLAAVDRGELVLGGCMVTGDDPAWCCRACAHCFV